MQLFKKTLFDLFKKKNLQVIVKEIKNDIKKLVDLIINLKQIKR